MTPDDRELLQTLRRQQLELQRSLARLDVQLQELEARAKATPAESSPPPLLPPEFPPLPPEIVPETSPAATDKFADLPALPTVAEPIFPDLPPVPPAPKPSLEFQLAHWFTRIGAVFLVLFVVFAAIYADVNYHLHERLGALGKIGIMGFIGAGVLALGQRLERKNAHLLVYGRTLMAGGLAVLYFTFYAAHYVQHLQIIHSPLAAGFLLLLWSAYVFLLAEQKKSQTLSLFAITLAYVSSAINPIGTFTMGADLVLAVTAVLFLLRNGWATLSYFSMAGTYFVVLRRLVYENGEIIFSPAYKLSFWPHATYLTGAWIIFTAAVLFSFAPIFRGGKRLAFLSLNNGAFAGLLALTAHIAGYDYGAVGWTLLTSGIALLFIAGLSGLGRSKADAVELVDAYLAQGLFLLTAGLIVIYTGTTRGVLLGLETLFLGMAGAFSRNFILRAATYLVAFFATLFLIWEISVHAHHPWLLGLGGALVMHLNAWWSRRDLRHDPLSREKIVLSASYYCVLALGLIYTAMSTELSDNLLPPALAWVAVGLTLMIYFVPLYECPPTAQAFLLAAQALVLFPAETGEELPWWSTTGVAAATLLIITWWSRQRVTRQGPWIILLNCVYALALVGLSYHAIRPYVGLQNWMVAASFLSVAFLLWGAFTRVWPLAAMGQVFLAVAVYHFYLPPGGWNVSPYPWAWWAAAVPVVTAFAIGRAIHGWLGVFPETAESCRETLRALGNGYLLLALALFVRWISVMAAPSDQISDFLLLGTLFLAGNVYRAHSFGIRCSFVLSAVGMLLYFELFRDQERSLATFLNGFAMLAFLAQPALLRCGNKNLVSPIESWALILLSAATGWLFVSAWVITRIHANYLTMGWALYALFLFLLGLLVRERRQRWCGLAVLLAAIVRVFVWDFWGFSGGYRVLTFLVLTIITLGLGFIYARFADRLKTLL